MLEELVMQHVSLVDVHACVKHVMKVIPVLPMVEENEVVSDLLSMATAFVNQQIHT